MTFQNLASGLGIDLGGWSWGAQFGDLNNDGRQDLYLTNGYVSAGERSSYWYDFSVIAVGHSTIIGDAANWPAIEEYCSFGWMKANAARSTPLGGTFWDGGADTFIHKGVNGRWTEVLSAAESADYERRAGRQLGAACARWLREGGDSD